MPSLPCKDSCECLSDKCMSDKCFGTNDGDTYNYPHYCNYRKTFRKESDKEEALYKSLDPLKEGGKCELDTDCELNWGFREGICTKYFSLEKKKKGRIKWWRQRKKKKMKKVVMKNKKKIIKKIKK